MKRTARCCVLALLLPTVAAAQIAHTASIVPAETLSLDAALRLAVAHNVSLQTTALQVEKANEDIAVARTRRLPSFETSVTASELLTPVGFTFPAGAFGVYPGTGPIPSTDMRITTPRQPTAYFSAQVSQPLSQLVGIGLRIRIAATARDIERERLRAQQLSLVSSVKRLYYAILQTQSAVATSTDAIDLYRELDRTVQHRLIQKAALRSDALDVQSRLVQEEFERIRLTNTLASQKEELNQLLGRDVRTTFEVEGVPEISLVDMDLEVAQSRALKNRPDIEEARLKLKHAELDYRQKRSDRIPEVSLSLSYSSYFNMDVLPRNLASAGVQVKWDPFDWGRAGHQLSARAHTIEQARLSVREAEERLVLEVNSLFRKLTEARALLNVVHVAQDTAREKLRVTTNRFQVQAALLSEVLQVRTEVSNAADRREQGLLAFWTAKANLEHALGEEVIR
jgi:outer membrane protein TolC